MLKRQVQVTKRRLRESAQGLVTLNPALGRIGLQLASSHEAAPDPLNDFPLEWKRTINGTGPYTMVPAERTGALIQAVEHVVANDVPGSVVECGTWKGGQSMAVALTLLRLGNLRDLYLYDTYEGMAPASEADVDGVDVLHPDQHTGELAVDREEVVEAMASTGYPMERVSVIKGLVEDTIPDNAPEEIAVLRLDTDFYASTLHELEHLFPRVPRGGVLIVDDYGDVTGCRKAVDEYFSGTDVFLHRIDYAGRLVIRT